MKQITSVAIGRKQFTITLDAYSMLSRWLENFRTRVNPASQANDVMVEIEERIADLFDAESTGPNYVVDVDLVRQVINRLGLPDGSYPDADSYRYEQRPAHRFYRDSDDKKIGGVCSGIATYFNVDVLIVRIIAILLLFMGATGFWAYIILWLICPLATTPLEKCELRGIPPTPENLRYFSRNKR